MDEYTKREIMGQSRHQFIYGYNGEERTNLLKSLENEYPIRIDTDAPMAIYLQNYGLPKATINNQGVDLIKLGSLSSEYLYFSIVYAILLKAKQDIGADILNTRITDILDVLNRYGKNPNYPNINNYDDLVNVIKQSRDFWYQYYMEYVVNGKDELSIEETPIPFLQLESFITKLKRALNNDSYFGIIVDKQKDIALSSTKAINFLVSGRINKDISMKVAIEPDEWDTYLDPNGQPVEAIHDYGTVELDDSFPNYMKTLRKKYDYQD